MPGLFREKPAHGWLADADTVRQHSDMFVGLGLALVLIGIIAIGLPFFAGMAATVTIGWLLVLAGVLEGYHAVRVRGWMGSGWEMLSAAVQVTAGLFLAAFPLAGKFIVTVILAVYFVAEGVLKLIRARQHQNMNRWGWLVFDGLLSVGLGVLMLTRWPGAAVWALGLLVGISLISGGSSMVLIGAGARQRARARS